MAATDRPRFLRSHRGGQAPRRRVPLEISAISILMILVVVACGGGASDPSASGFARQASAGAFAMRAAPADDLHAFVAAADLTAVGVLRSVRQIEGTPVEDAEDPNHHEIPFMVHEIEIQQVIAGELDGPGVITVPAIMGLAGVDELNKLIPEEGIRVIVIAKDSSNLVDGVIDGSYIARDAGFILEGDNGRALTIGGRPISREAEIDGFSGVRSFEDAIDAVAAAASAPIDG